MDRDHAAGVLLGLACGDAWPCQQAITHYDDRCRYGCAVLNGTVAGYLRGEATPLGSALERVAADARGELPVTDGGLDRTTECGREGSNLDGFNSRRRDESV